MSILDSLKIILVTLLEKFYPYILIFIIIVCLIMIIKIIYTKYKYGFDHFDIFKKRQEINVKQELILTMLHSNKRAGKIIKLNNSYSLALMINKDGIFIFSYYEYMGTITGKYGDEKLKLKDLNSNERLVHNPFMFIKKDANRLEKILNKEINEIIIINNYCTFLTECNKEVLILEQNIPSENFKGNDNLTDEEIKEITDTLIKNIDCQVM